HKDRSARIGLSRAGLGARASWMPTTKDDLPFASAELAAELVRWRAYLSAERRTSLHTVTSYARDVNQFLAFLAEHLGGRVTIAALARISPQDVRAFMAARRAGGISGRS